MTDQVAHPTSATDQEEGVEAFPPIDPADLATALRSRVDGEVRLDAGSRAAYATDASNYRSVPLAVVVPRSVEAAAEAIGVCRDLGVPVFSRGGGTSLAGQATNAAVVLDFSKYCHAVLEVDAEARRCTVEPGIVLDELNHRLAEHGLRFGPEPATHQNCTIGGMIGNNSCGATAQRTGKVVDNIRRLEVQLYDGTRFWCGPTSDEEYAEIEARGDRRAQIYRSLRRLRDDHGDLVRERFPDIPRRVSGYNLDSLLPEHGFDVAGLLVGSESTLVTVLRAELDLVPVVRARTLVVLGFPDIAAAAEAVPDVLAHDPIALEGVDHFLLRDQRLQSMNASALGELPEGTGFLMVQLGGEDHDESQERARRMLDGLARSRREADVRVLDDPTLEDRLWQVREAGLGATAHPPHRRDTWEGWEDSAVPVDRLGSYLRDLRRLYADFGLESDTGPSLYGHFGQGCVHTRIPFDLYTADGVATYRRFLERAADLVTSYGGSLSGEHGDGQTRGELLPRMFGDQVVGLFEEVKGLFDPADRMNPGKVVRPRRLDENLRLGGSWSPHQPRRLHFAYPEDGGSFRHAANRCVGVGKCRKHDNDGGTVMCPSYQVTREEVHSTRGRARLLFEMLDGHGDGPITDGWRSTEVKEALDLCLACKGCKADCPVSVDMATYKAEFLAQHYRHRLRPRADYATGWIPVLAAGIAASRTARPINALARTPGLHRLMTRAAGLEHRPLPTFSTQTLQQWWKERPPAPPVDGPVRGTVLLWPDTFTNAFHPEIGRAAVRVLEDAGWQVNVPTEPICCGLTWISTGQLPMAKRVLRRTLRQVAPHIRAGGLVVGLEPSCTAVFRSDLTELLPHDLDAARLEESTVTLAELLTRHTDGWRPPPPPSPRQQVLAQVHCHQHAVLGWDSDSDLLGSMGVHLDRLDSGCCGLAGNFGFTAGHGQVSEACAEQTLLPRLRQAMPQTPVLADGFSCRTQIHDLDSGGHEAMHLAELLAAGLPDDGGRYRGDWWRPERPWS